MRSAQLALALFFLGLGLAAQAGTGPTIPKIADANPTVLKLVIQDQWDHGSDMFGSRKPAGMAPMADIAKRDLEREVAVRALEARLPSLQPAATPRCYVAVAISVEMESKVRRNSNHGSGPPFGISRPSTSISSRGGLGGCLRLAQGALRSGPDYYFAALIMQHSPDADGILLAHVLSVKAVAAGDQDGLWMAAATLDRYLIDLKQPQVFGTQFCNPRAKAGRWNLTIVPL